MALKEPSSMDECIYFTNRTLVGGKGKIRAWVYRKFCPKCGFTYEKQNAMNMFNDDFLNHIFSRMQKQMKDVDRSFDKEFEVRDITPLFKISPKNGSGFTIKIIRAGNEEPKVSVNTFGNVNKEDVDKEVYQHLKGMGVGIGTDVKNKPTSSGNFWKFGRSKDAQMKKVTKTPKITEEPKATMNATPYGVSVDVELPNIKNTNDIEIKDLENSIEIKAISGDKAYFKILTKPSHFRLKRRIFDKGVLHLEFA